MAPTLRTVYGGPGDRFTPRSSLASPLNMEICSTKTTITALDSVITPSTAPIRTRSGRKTVSGKNTSVGMY